MTMADKIVVLHDGVIEQIGAPLDLYDRPANLFVAGFIGSPAMKFIRGRVEEGVFRYHQGADLPKPQTADPAETGGRDFVTASAGTYHALPNKRHLRARRTGGGDRFRISPSWLHGRRYCLPVRERLDIVFGDTVSIAVDPASVHLFDRETGKRIDKAE